MKKRIIALLLCLSMLLPMFTGSVVANSGGDYSANVGRFAVLADIGYGIQVGNVTDITTGNDVFLLYEEFEPGTIFQITDWYIDPATSSLWYEVEVYSGGVIPEAQEYWPSMPWILQDYIGEGSTGDSLVFIDTCDTCGKPDCGGHDTTNTTKVYLDGAAVSQVSMPRFDKPTLAADTTLDGEVSYRWQILADAQTQLWVNIYGENSQELTLTYGMVATLLDSSNQAWVRCVTTAGGAEAVSDALLITLEPYVAPSEPVEMISEPIEETTEPTEETSAPTEEPSEPTEEASAPTEEPSEPTEELSAPTEELSAPTEEISAPIEETTEPIVETSAPAEDLHLTQESMRLLPLEQRMPHSASTVSAEEGDSGDEDLTRVYHVTIHYVFQDGITPAASTDSITVGATGVMQNPIRYPAVQGYLPYVINAAGDYERQDEFAAKTLTADIETTVYYLPTEVQYQIVVYQQNVDNDNYTRLPDTIVRYAQTGSLVPDFTQKQPDDVKLEYEGFYPLLHEMPVVAADGSTLVEMYFDRYYYLINFNLDGGYGVEPIYARYGMPIEVMNPTRPGYHFGGWLDRNNNVVSIPDTMPAGGGTYRAQWKSADTSYKVSYWIINDDGTRSLIGTRVEPGISGQTVDGKDDLKGSVICGNETLHTHTADCFRCCQPGNAHTVACFINPQQNIPGEDGEAVIKAVSGGTNPESGYIYVIETEAGNLWPKLYLDGTYYTVNGVTADNNSATEEQVNKLIEGDALGTGEYSGTDGLLIATKYKPNIQNTHTDANRICQEHTHDNTCYQDTTYLEYVETVTITKEDNTTVTYTTDQGIAVKGDGTSVVNVYYRYKEYTLRFYYAATTGGTDSDNDKDPNTYDTIKIVGGSTWSFAKNGSDTSDDETLLEDIYWENPGEWGQISALPSLNANGLAKNYNHGTEVFSHNQTAVTYHYISFKARYGDNISGMWPCSVFNSATRTDKNDTNGWSGTEAFVSAWSGEHHVKYSQENDNQTIKGKYEKLDENLLFDPAFADESTVSYLCFWENGANIGWSVPELYRYNIYLQTYSGQDLTDKTTITRNGKTYYLADSYDTCDNSTVAEQTQVSLMGYEKAGYTSAALTDFDKTLYKEAHEVNFFYNAKTYRLSFWNWNDYLTDGTGSLVAYNEPLKKYFEGITVDGTVYEGANDLVVKPEYYPTSLEPDAYEFEGWYTSAQFEPETKVNPDNIKMPDEALMVYANWIPKLHHIRLFLTVDLADAGSTPMEEFHIFHGELVPEANRPADPVNGDYQFIGWFYKDENGTEHAFDFANMPVKDSVNLYAKWSSNVLKSYTIRYVTIDASGNEIEIASPTTGSALAGSTKTFEAKGGSALYAGYREGYFPLVKSHSITLNIDQEGTASYTFEYIQKESVSYTVHYYQKDLNGNPVYETDETGDQVNVPVHPSKTASTKQSEVVENYVMVTGYRPDDFQKKLVVSGEAGADNTIIFWYQPNTTHAFLRVNHYLEDIPAPGSTEITWTSSPDYSYANEVLIVGNTIQHFSESPVSIEGFTYDPNVPGTVLEGDLSAVGQELELKLYYQRNEYPYQIRYLEYGTNKVLADPKPGTAYYGDAITATEADIQTIDGYTYHSRVGCTIGVENDQDRLIRNFVTVYYVPVTGSLKITKQIDVINNNAPDPFGQEFEFMVAVPNGMYPVTIGENTQNITVTDGTLRVYLKGGQSATIDGLPQGPSTNKHQYTITETPVPGFDSSFSPAGTVTVSDGQTTSVTCINAYPVGNLTITKTVEKEYIGDTWTGGAFDFTIISNDLPNSKPYKVMINGTEKTYWVSDHTITLNDIAVSNTDTPVTIAIENLPGGSYTVTEKETEALKAAYTTTANGTDGYSATVNVEPVETPATVNFVNTFKRTTGDLYVSKEIQIVPDSGATLDPKAEFSFTVHMPNDVAASYFAGETYTVKEHSTIKEVAVGNDGTFTFKLKHGEHLIMEDLPSGSYVITEAPAQGYASSFPTPNPVDGSVSETVTITTNAQTELKCFNTYPVHVGNLKITKTVQNDSGLAKIPEDSFTFNIEFTVMGNNLTFPATYSHGDPQKATLTAVRNGDNAVLTVELKDGESVLIEKLPEGECTVTEVNIPVGYTASEYDGSIAIAPDQTQTLDVVNKFKPPTLTIRKTNAEAGQVFVYEVKNNTTNEIINVTVIGNSSTTIHDLRPGEYTVTQRNNWSWRYGDAAQTVTLPAEGTTVTFDDGKQKDSWLDGNSALVKNQRGG